MVARTRPERGALVVVFERDGEKALYRALTILLAHPKLQVGDRLTIEAAD